MVQTGEENVGSNAATLRLRKWNNLGRELLEEVYEK
jgi:hypothetical protein